VFCPPAFVSSFLVACVRCKTPSLNSADKRKTSTPKTPSHKANPPLSKWRLCQFCW
jgi:hypothetical protein